MRTRTNWRTVLPASPGLTRQMRSSEVCSSANTVVAPTRIIRMPMASDSRLPCCWLDAIRMASTACAPVGPNRARSSPISAPRAASSPKKSPATVMTISSTGAIDSRL